MLEKVSAWALKNWLGVIFFTFVLAGIGFLAFQDLTIEAFPDPTDPQVQVITQFPGQPTEEVERQITLPLERSLNGLPGLMRMRSINIFGLSNITCTFTDNINLEQARQQILERLRDAELPEGVVPALSPNATPIGEIYRYVMEGAGGDALKLRRLQDWFVRPRLLRVQGVADVVTFGGLSEEIHVQPSPMKMLTYGIKLSDIEEALKKSSVNASGGMLQRGAEGFVISSHGLFQTVQDIGNIGVTEHRGTPILLRNIAEISRGWSPRQGVATHGSNFDVVEGTIVMRRGENPTIVLKNVRDAIDQINHDLPDGAKMVPFYDRTDLVNHTLETVSHNLIEGAVLVTLVLWIFLMNLRAALIVAGLIPLSLLTGFIYLHTRGMSANLLSMGAVDFGVIVDGGVVIIESILLKLQHNDSASTPTEAIQKAVAAVIRPTVFSMGIIMAAYLPIFMLQRVEGRIFTPMAHTVVSALVGALLLSITLVPVLSWLFFHKRAPKHVESPVLRLANRIYEPVLKTIMRMPLLVLGLTIVLLGAAVWITPQLGSEFLPSLNEGSLYVTFTLPQNISLQEGRRLIPGLYAALHDHPVVKDILFQLGRPEDGTDPNLPNNLEAFIRLKDPHEWPKNLKTVDDIVEDMTPRIKDVPGMDVSFSQPIADNVNDSISGQPGDIAVKLYGSDLVGLQDLAEKWKDKIATVQGVADLGLVRSGLQPQLQITPDRAALSRYGIGMEDFQHTIDAALGGIQTGELWEGEIPVPIVMRFPENARNEGDKVARLGIPLAPGKNLPLNAIADVRPGFGRLSIFRENGRRYIGVRMNVRGRDMGSFVNDAIGKVKAVPMPKDVNAEWGGAFESKERAMKRLGSVVPVSLIVTLVLLFAAFGNILPALLVLLTIPLALVGGIFGLMVMHLPISVAAAVGFIALIGQASLNGVLILSAIRERQHEGLEIGQAVLEGCLERLRPVLMTGTLAALGLLPAAMSREMGAETQQPLAVVVVGGTLSAMLLTLLVLPVLYAQIDKLTRNTSIDPDVHEYDHAHEQAHNSQLALAHQQAWSGTGTSDLTHTGAQGHEGKPFAPELPPTSQRGDNSQTSHTSPFGPLPRDEREGDESDGDDV